MNSAISIGCTVALGALYCWTSRLKGMFFFGRTADAALRASEEASAITRRYLTRIALVTAVSTAIAWEGGHLGRRSLGAGALLLEIVACWLIFARANGEAKLLTSAQLSPDAPRGAVQVALLEQPRYWIPGLLAIMLPAAVSVAALGTAVMLAAHGAGLSAGWAAFGDSADLQGDGFVAGIATGMLTAATAMLLLFRASARLRTNMAQYTVRSCITMEWIGAIMLVGVLACNHFGVVLSRSASRGVVLIALVVSVGTMVWNQARAKRFVPPPVEVGGDERWRWGLFYVDRNDPALFVQSRCGAGYTLNYGRMAAWPISLGLAAYVIGVLFFLPHRG